MEDQLLSWIEEHSTLHTSVEILYVVDGYEVSVTNDNPRSALHTHLGPFWGASVKEALTNALNGRKGR